MKHAYLIIANNDDLSFQTLIKMLDHEENDLFIHFDAKERSFTKQRMEELVQSAKKSGIFFTDRIKANWGSYSLVKCELILLEKATETRRYDYYHLLSGKDLPIQTHHDIQRFFSDNKGYQFVGTGPLKDDGKYHDSERIKYYHFFQERIGRNGNKIWRKAGRVAIKIQKILGIDRKRETEFMRGPQWFSITHDLARYILEQKPRIEKLFRYSFCADELFVQTIIHGTHFEKDIYPKGTMRCTDWNRGNPYTWREEDFDTLKEDERIFARKFDASVDKGIINKVYSQYCL